MQNASIDLQQWMTLCIGYIKGVWKIHWYFTGLDQNNMQHQSSTKLEIWFIYILISILKLIDLWKTHPLLWIRVDSHRWILNLSFCRPQDSESRMAARTTQIRRSILNNVMALHCASEANVNILITICSLYAILQDHIYIFFYIERELYWQVVKWCSAWESLHWGIWGMSIIWFHQTHTADARDWLWRRDTRKKEWFCVVFLLRKRPEIGGYQMND